MYTASLRAPEGYNLPVAMSNCQTQHPSLFDKFGGHPCAAGFTISDPRNLPIAKNLMLENLKEQGKSMINTATSYNGKIITPQAMKDLVYRPEILWLNEDEITKDFLVEIMQMDPFGQDFPLPMLAFEVLPPTINNKKWLGQDQKHIKLVTKNNCTLTFFNLTEEFSNFFKDSSQSSQPKLWVTAKPSQNCWNNTRTIEMVVDKVFVD